MRSFFHLICLLPTCTSFMVPMSRSQLLSRSASIVAGVSTALVLPLATTADEGEEDYANTPPIERVNNKIYYYTAVNGASCSALRRAIADATLESQVLQLTFSQSEPLPIELHIQSPGGSLMHAFNIVDYIQRNPVPIHSYVDGYAASAATLMSVVCAKRYAYTNSLMLLHQLSGGAEGKYSAVVEDVQNLALMMDMCKKIYLENTMMREKELDEILRHDIWYSAQTCLDKGIVDEIVR
jgi:ATP-dependent protease ClpP protease subunit